MSDNFWQKLHKLKATENSVEAKTSTKKPKKSKPKLDKG